MEAKGDFVVKQTKAAEVVTAALPLQEHWLPLSNLDLLLPPLDVNVFFCYDLNTLDLDFMSMVNVLKHALAETLVSYYALTGEIVSNSTGEPELLCNNRGVDFIVAYSDVELRSLNLYEPDKTISKFVPKKEHGVIALQVTELKCGSIVVGCTFDHRAADAHSANMFFVSWAERARANPVSPPPSFRRSLLNPRRPLCPNTSYDELYIPLSKLPPPQETSHDNLISRIYYIKSDKLNDLQKLASSNNETKRTKLESFSALVWKLVAKSDRRGDETKISKLGIVVDGRTRLGGTGDGKIQMTTYFGNVLSVPHRSHKMSDLVGKPLPWVASEVHGLLENAVTKEHFMGLIDWVEAQRPVPMVCKVYSTGPGDGPACVVSSGQRFPVKKVDFGWGPPIFGSYHFPWGGNTGYVMPMPSATVDGDWVVYLHLTQGQLKLIEDEAADMFKPMSVNYVL